MAILVESHLSLPEYRSSSNMISDNHSSSSSTEEKAAHLQYEIKSDSGELGAFSIETDFIEIEQLAQQASRKRTFWQKLLDCEFELEFKDKKHMVWLLGAFASAAGILSGVDQSIISGASIGMNTALKLTDHQSSLVSSLMPLGAMAGSMMMTPLSEYFGRKKAIVISCLWYSLGAGLCAGANSHEMMFAGRFILGIGVGIEGGSVGIYIAESVPAHVRGNLVSMYQFNIALGEVFGFAIAAIFYDIHGGWRYMVGSSLVFSTILFIGLLFLPESPRYLMYKGKVGESYNVWKRLRNADDESSKVEFLEMRHNAIIDEDRRAHESKFQVWMDLFTIPRNRRALFYAVLMVSFGQLTGINAVMYYLSTLMHKIGFNIRASVFMSLVGGGSLLIGTIPAILWMDRFGRRVWGMNIIGFFIGLVLVGVGYRFNSVTQKEAALGVYLTGLILYMSFFGAYACLTWVLPAESFSLSTRSVGMTICSTFLYLWSFTVTYNFTKMQNAFTYTGLTLGFYGGIAFIGFIYQILFMPETKDKTLEEIDDIFSKSSFQVARENISNVKRFWGFS